MVRANLCLVDQLRRHSSCLHEAGQQNKVLFIGPTTHHRLTSRCELRLVSIDSIRFEYPGAAWPLPNIPRLFRRGLGSGNWNEASLNHNSHVRGDPVPVPTATFAFGKVSS